MKHPQEPLDESRQGEALLLNPEQGSGKKLYLESYGCQMNFSDSEIVASLLAESGFSTTRNLYESDVILLNTCAIRENAEQRVRTRLRELQHLKKAKPTLVVGVLGCMAERLKDKFLEEEKLVDLVAGPDAYRALPSLIAEVESGQKPLTSCFRWKKPMPMLARYGSPATEFRPLSALCAAATTCAPFAWCLLPADANAAAIQKAFCKKPAICLPPATVKLPFWAKM